MPIQLQPQGLDLNRWILLAREEGLSLDPAEPFSLPSCSDPRNNQQIAEQLRKTGLVTSIHGAFIDVNPASADPRIRELSRQRCRESCETALWLGAECVIFHCSAFPFLRGDYLKRWAADCAAFYQELADAYPVHICIENAQDLDPEPLVTLMTAVGSDRVGVCLDVGHAHYSRVPVERWFDDLGDWIGCLHLSDNEGMFDDHFPLGKGSVNWDAVHRSWKALGREIPITLETGSLESTRESLVFLREHRYFGLKGK